MKKVIYILILLVSVSFENVFCQGFFPAVIYWTLPAGGLISPLNSSFNSLASSINSFSNGSQTWTILDMNGDGIKDLVVLTEVQLGAQNVFNLSNSPYWKVYLGASYGFSSTAINWSLPAGGLVLNSVNRSFNELNSPGTGNTDGSQSWSTFDVNGDAIPDLVILTELQAGTYNVFNLSASPYWKVHLGTSTGFSSTAINWTLPPGGLLKSSVNRSFNSLSNPGNGDTDGSQSWNISDFNGDGFIDLVVFTQRTGGYHVVFNLSSNPYWKVYLGSINGFSSTAINWSLPAGGLIVSSVNTSFIALSNPGMGSSDGSQTWKSLDLNEDGLIDLCVLTERVGGIDNVFNLSVSPNWKVFLGTPTGFSSTAIDWALPAGGLILSSINYSFYALSNSGNGNTDGSQNWDIKDMNGDSKPDLTIYAERQLGVYNVFNLSTNPSWKVFLNTGSGFSLSPINWSLPAGGLIDNNVNYSFNGLSTTSYGNTNGSQAWSVIDMNGDHQLDLLVYLERQAGDYEVFNLATSPYWKLYFGNATTSSIETNDGSNSNLYEVYPNPVNDVLTVKSNLNTNEKLKVSLTNILGQIQFEKEFSSNESLNDFQIQMNTYTKGFYFLTIQSNKGSHTFKVQDQ